MFVYLSYITPFVLSVFPWPPVLNVLLIFTESSVLSGHQTVPPTLRHTQNISALSERTVLCSYGRDAKKPCYFHLGKIVCIYSCTHKFVQNCKLRFVLQLSTAYIKYALTLIYIPHNKIPSKLLRMILFILGYCKLPHTCCMFASSSVTVCSLFYVFKIWKCNLLNLCRSSKITLIIGY